MSPDPARSTEAHDDASAAVGLGVGLGDGMRGPFSLASLLGLNEDELAQPLSRLAPAEHRWEHLSLGGPPDGGEAIPIELRTSVATQPPEDDAELIPGLNEPGAIEVPVYLAGRTLDDFLRNTPLSTDVVATDETIVTGTSDSQTRREDLNGNVHADSDADATGSTESLADSARGAAQTRVPAIAVKPVGRLRKTPEAPIANFARAADGIVLWPRRKVPRTPSVLPQECAKCGTAFTGDKCRRCGYDTAVPTQLAHADRWGHFIAAFLDSESRMVRTIGALILAPGELTSAHIAGRPRRYFGPVAIVTVAVLLFAAISAMGGLRPRPDRALMIGTTRTAEALPGLVESGSVNLAVDNPPDIVREIATTMDYIPLLWLPFMAFCVIAVVAAMQSVSRRDDRGDVVFAAHFTSWFVLWWGLAVPMLLLLIRFGFEYSAAWDGVEKLHYLANGQIDGLSPAWNELRAYTVAPAFHSWLVGIGLAPWAVIAYRRAFDTSWLVAGIGGFVTAAVPLVLLSPFA